VSAARAIKMVPGLSGPVEDYLKAIYDLERSGEAAETNAIAKRLNIAPPSVSGMVRRLAKYGLITHEKYHGARLTAAGRKAALQTIRRHRVIEAYLTEALGYSWDRVHDEAERLEHAASDELIDRMAKAIGEPETDPHGAPIPTREGTLKEKAVMTLASLTAGATARVERVSDESPERLRYLKELGIVPGAPVKLVERAPFDGPITVKVDASKKTISAELATQILVTRK
jgi:DtxR family Mn-dependent transcriptional regulator